MRRGMIFFVCLMIVSGLQAQRYNKVSGYLGKRLAVGINLGISPSRQPQKATTESTQEFNQFTVNRFLSTHLDYATGTYTMLGVSAGFQSTSSRVVDEAYNSLYWGEQYNWDSYEHRLIGITGSPDIKDLNFGFYLKRFLSQKGAIAPIGSYFKFGAVAHNYSIDLSRVTLISLSQTGFGNEDVLEHKLDPTAAKVSTLEFFGTIGIARPLHDRVLLDLSMGGGYMKPFIDDNTEGHVVSLYVLDQISTRLRRQHIVRFNFGLSFLL